MYKNILVNGTTECPMELCRKFTGFVLGCPCSDALYCQGECCFNSLSLCGSRSKEAVIKNHLESLLERGEDLTTCEKVTDFYSREELVFRMFSKCPQHSENQTEIFMCESKHNTTYWEAVTPVYDNVTQRLYRNRYCAACNNVTTSMIPTTPQFVCRNFSDVFNTLRLHGVDAVISYMSENCDLMFDFGKMDFSYSWRLCPGRTVVQTVNKTIVLLNEKHCINDSAFLTYSINYTSSQIQCAICKEVSGYCDDYSDQRSEYIRRYRHGPAPFTILLDFSAENWLSKNIEHNQLPLCSQYVDALSGKCLNKNSKPCSNAEILVSNACKRINFNFSFSKDATQTNYLYIILRKSNISKYSDEEIFHFLKSIIPARLLLNQMFNCNQLSLDLSPVYSEIDQCKALALKPVSDTFSWVQLIDMNTWKTVFEYLLRNDYSLRVTVISHSTITKPICTNGSFRWYSNFTYINDDYDLRHNELFIPSSGKSYALTSDYVAIHITWSNISDEKSSVIHYGVCELNVFGCDKVSFEVNSYNVHVTNSSHAHIVIYYSNNNSALQSDVSLSDFIITEDGALLVCSEVLAKMVGISGPAELLFSIHEIIHEYLTFIGLTFSAICLTLTFVIHCRFPVLQNTAGKVVMNLCVSLTSAQLLFLLSGVLSFHYILCKLSAVTQHFFWLVSFCWTNVFALSVSFTFADMKRGLINQQQEKAFLPYMLYAWGVPACVCTVCIIIDMVTDFPLTYGWEENPAPVCWIFPGTALFYSFGLPLILIISINGVCFLISLIIYFQTRSQTQLVTASGSNAGDIIICLKLSSVMGFTWLFGFLSNIPSLWFFSYIFIIFNTLQGVSLSLSFTFTKRIFYLLKSDASSTSSATRQSQNT